MYMYGLQRCKTHQAVSYGSLDVFEVGDEANMGQLSSKGSGESIVLY